MDDVVDRALRAVEEAKQLLAEHAGLVPTVASYVDQPIAFKPEIINAITDAVAPEADVGMISSRTCSMCSRNCPKVIQAVRFDRDETPDETGVVLAGVLRCGWCYRKFSVTTSRKR